MGIPGFASRIRSHGSVSTIGRKGEPCDDHAVIDGPSLAHSLLQSSEISGKSGGGILPSWSYSALGKAAVAWLDALQEHGFMIEAIYFDGILPEHKKDVRIDRLQAYVDKLVKFKTVHDELEKATKNSALLSPEMKQRRIEAAERSLPPPPFLVFAVMDALRESEYADRTYTVDGEADDFCAAKTFELSRNANCTPVTIFTNDSDLVIYNLPKSVRVVQINEMSHSQDENGSFLTSLAFYPSQLRKVERDEELSDLVRPAYLMKLDYHLSFKNAMLEPQRQESCFTTTAFREFAATYDLSEARSSLDAIAQSRNDPLRYLDSRISELLRTLVQEGHRIREVREWYDNEEERLLERTRAGLKEGWQHLQESSGLITRDFAYDPKEEALKPIGMDLFLPILFEDTSRATAWKAGTKIRGTAVHLASTMLCGTAATVREHKRSGQRVRGTECQLVSSTLCRERLVGWTQQWTSHLSDMKGLDSVSGWRTTALRHLLIDLAEEEKPLPTQHAATLLLTNDEAPTWDQVHLQAQYQAVFYSLRMLKQVLGFLAAFKTQHGQGQEHGDDKLISDALTVLSSLPDVAAFFEPRVSEDEGTMTALDMAVEQLFRDCGVNVQEAKEEGSERANGGKKRKGKKKVKEGDENRRPRQTQNAFAMLDEGEDSEG